MIYGNIFLAVLIIAIVYAIKSIKVQTFSTKKIDKISAILNVILTIVYIPMSGFSALMFMASEGTINATNQLYITLINVFCYITISVPIICIICILTFNNIEGKR